MKSVILISLAIVASFFAGSVSMYFLIQSRASYMSQGVFIDKNHDMSKFGVHSGKEYSKENPYNYVPVDWLVKEVEFDIMEEHYKDNQREDIQRALKLAKSGKYSVYYFSNNITMWYSLKGVEGYCVVDKSENSLTKWIVLAGFITSMS